MANQQYNATLSIEPSELAHLNRILVFQQTDYIKGDSYEEYEKLRQYSEKDAAVREFLDSIHEDGDLLFYKKVPFADGKYAEIMVTAPESIEDTAYAEAFLHDKDGNMIGEADSDFRLDRQWKMVDRDGNQYVLYVQEIKEKNPIEEHFAGLHAELLKALNAPQNYSFRPRGKRFLEGRDTAYNILTNNLPVALELIEKELPQHAPDMPAHEAVGNYLYTGHLGWKPVGQKAQDEARKIVPALHSFIEKCKIIHGSYLAEKQDPALQGDIPMDILMYVDTARALQKTVPKFTDGVGVLPSVSFSSIEKAEAWKMAYLKLSSLRGRIPHEENDSLANKTMREVYSKTPDCINYDKLNQEAVAKLLKQGASDKAIREVAEIAKTINPSIQDTKAYMKDLVAKTKKSHETMRS